MGMTRHFIERKTIFLLLLLIGIQTELGGGDKKPINTDRGQKRVDRMTNEREREERDDT